MVHLREPADIVPDRPEARVEYVRAIAVDVDAVPAVAIDVAAHVVPLFHDKAGFPPPRRFVRERRAKKAAPHDQIVVYHRFNPFMLWSAPRGLPLIVLLYYTTFFALREVRTILAEARLIGRNILWI